MTITTRGHRYPVSARGRRYRELCRRRINRNICNGIMRSIPSIREVRGQNLQARIAYVESLADQGFVDRRRRRPRPLRPVEEEAEEVVNNLGFRRRSRWIVGRRGDQVRTRVVRKLDFSVFTSDRRWIVEIIAHLASHNYRFRHPEARGVLGGVAGPIEESLGEIFTLILAHLGVSKNTPGLELHDIRQWL